ELQRAMDDMTATTHDLSHATTAPASARGPMAPAYRLVTLAIVALVTTVAFEAMAISTAMPVVARELDAVRSYSLAFSVMLTAQLLGIVLAGVWSDRRGPLPGLISGQVLLAGGSALAGLATSFPILLAGRFVAGLGGGLVVVALYVVIGRAYPDALRPKVFTWVSAAWVLPALVGPPVAGWLATQLSWRWVFLVVVPAVALTLLAVLSQRSRLADECDRRDVPADERAAHRRTAWLGLGVATAAAALQWGTQALVPPQAWPILLTALGVVVLGATAPRLLPHGTLRLARGLPSVVLSRFLLTASFNGSLAFVPLMLVSQRHLKATEAGIVLTIGALGWSFGSWVQGRDAFLHRRTGLVMAGGTSLTLGIAGMAVVAAAGLPSVLVGACQVLAGLGMGLAMSTTSVLSLQLASEAERGRASSALQLADALGSVLGIATSGAVFAALHHANGHDTGVFVLIWSGMAAVAALVVLGGHRSRT
ncbi:MAG: MFS transporter, partial [Oryzihumus sp.]